MKAIIVIPILILLILKESFFYSLKVLIFIYFKLIFYFHLQYILILNLMKDSDADI
jgi:hypothetical protein